MSPQGHSPQGAHESVRGELAGNAVPAHETIGPLATLHALEGAEPAQVAALPVPESVAAAVGNILDTHAIVVEEGPATAAMRERMEADRSKEIFRLSRNKDTYEVTVESDLTLKDWEKITPKEDWALMINYADNLKQELAKRPEDNRTVVFINPTMEGGGVAMMRPPLIHIMRLLGIDARWYVMEGQKAGEPNPFEVTKKIHNIIQRRLPDTEHLTKEEKAIHKNWVAQNAAVLLKQDAILKAAVVNIDDPQPAPLVRPLKQVNPGVKIPWRNHIDNSGDLLMDPSTPQGEVHDYLHNELGLGELADAFIYHPDINDNFVPADSRDKAWLSPATIEPHDDMNRELIPAERVVGREDVNMQIRQKNWEAMQEGRLDDVQQEIDINRDRIVLIARFDESKGMDQAMELGNRTREVLIQMYAEAGITDREPPQLILIGNGSKDDPSGTPMEQEMLKLRREKYGHMKQDIIVQRLLHNYVAINSMMYNENPSRALVALQLSTAEGCETRITDWLDHGIPAVVANVGGMPLQVQEGKSGIILDTNKDGDVKRRAEISDEELDRGARELAELIFDINKYQQMRRTTQEAADEFNRRVYTTTANVTRLVRIFGGALTGAKPDRLWKIDDLLAQQSQQATA